VFDERERLTDNVCTQFTYQPLQNFMGKQTPFARFAQKVGWYGIFCGEKGVFCVWWEMCFSSVGWQVVCNKQANTFCVQRLVGN